MVKGDQVPKPKIVLFDIEASNLSANFGYMLCASYKYLDRDKIHTIKISDYPLFKRDCTNDYEVAKRIGEVLTDADGWIGHYSRKYDEPFINTRLIYHGLPILPSMGQAHIDTWRICRYKLKLNSNRLASAAAFFGLEEKTALSGPIWIKAQAGHKPSLKYVYEHCRQDVLVLEQVYKKIKAIETTSHFNVALAAVGKYGKVGMVCPRCATEGQLQSRGWRYAKVQRTKRYWCKACGAWSNGKAETIASIR